MDWNYLTMFGVLSLGMVIGFDIGVWIKRKQRVIDAGCRTKYKVKVIRAVNGGHDYVVEYEETLTAPDGIIARDIVALKYDQLRHPGMDTSMIFIGVGTCEADIDFTNLKNAGE